MVETIDLGRAFKAVFDDAEWLKKAALAIVWYFLIVTAPVLIGAEIEYIKRVYGGDERLPDWDGFGDKWLKGFFMWLAMLLFMAPIWLLMFAFMIPAILAGSGGGNDEVFGSIMAGGMCLWYVFVIIYSIALWLYALAALTNYAMKGKFSAFFEFQEIWERIKATGSNYWMALLYSLVIGFATGVAMMVLEFTIIGFLVIPAVLYLGMMGMAHLLGQWARQAYAPSAPVTPSAPVQQG